MKKRNLLLSFLFGVIILSSCGGNNASKPSSISSSKEPVISQTSSSKPEPVKPSSSSKPIENSSTVSSPKEDEYKPTPMPNPDKSIYLIGAAVWGWSSYAKLTLMTDNIFYGTFDLKTSAEGFVITSQTNYDGYVFHDSNGANFKVSKYGTYNVYFTYDETKIDSTWKQASEKSNAVVAYYKFELESSIEVPIDEDMMFINGPAVEGWGTYIPLFEDESGVYSYIYGLKANGEGFTITSEEDNEHLVYHKENGSNFTVSHAGDYRIMFTYNDMSNDDTWGLAKEQNNGKDGYYKFEPLFEIPGTEEPTPEPDPTPDPDPKPEPDPTPDPNPGDDVTLGQLYIFGGATGGWENKVVLPEVSEGVYQKELQLTASNEGFVVCELEVLSDKTGFCLHDENGENFKVKYAGAYELSITWNDMSNDSNWKVAKEVNGNDKGDAFYKLVPLFEIEENPENPTINTLYLNGVNVGGWNSYIQLNKVNDNLFVGEVNFSSSPDGFVITAQQNRNGDGLVFKHADGKNLNVESAGRYKVSFSLVEVDDTWFVVTDTKGNYDGECYVKIEPIIDTRTNLMLGNNVSAEASTTTGEKTANKVFDGESGDLTRWESVQGVDPQWILIDLGSEHTVNEIEIQWYGAASAKTYTIEFAGEDGVWRTVEEATNTNGTRNRLDKVSISGETARYIRITGTSRVATYGYSIGELYVWGV